MNDTPSITVGRATAADIPAVVDFCMMVEAQHEAYNLARWKTKPNIREGYLRWMGGHVDSENLLIGVARENAAPPNSPQPHIPQTHFRSDAPGDFAGRAPNPTRVVGVILVGLQDEIPIYTYRQYAFIHDMAVADSHRRRGVALQLLAHARDWSIARGVPQLRLMVADKNTDARAAFERFGFQLTYHEMILPLTT